MIVRRGKKKTNYEIISEVDVTEISNCNDFLLSLIVPCYNEEETLSHTYEKIITELKCIKNIEIILIDDGSTDSTWSQLKDISAKNVQTKIIKLSRNFGHQSAVTAGLMEATGDCMVIIDADLQDPPRIILKMLELWRRGYFVVFGKRKTRGGETLFKIITARLFYKLLGSLSDNLVPRDTGDFRLIDKKINQCLLEMPEYDRFLRGMIAWIGFPQVGIEYIREVRQFGNSKYTLRKMISLATSGVLSFSLKPLRFAMLLGAVSSSLALIILIYAVFMKIFGNPVPGWTTLTVMVSFFSGVQLLSIGVLGEYVGRAFIQTKQRPNFIIEKIIGQKLKK